MVAFEFGAINLNYLKKITIGNIMEHAAALLIHKLINAVIDMKPNRSHLGFEPNLSKTLRETRSCKPVISIALAMTRPP